MNTEEDGAWNTEGPMRMSRRVRCLNVMEGQYQRSAEWWRMTVDMENTRFHDQKDPDPYTGEDIMDFFIFTKASSSLTPQTKVLFFFVRSKRGRAMSEKCSMNRR